MSSTRRIVITALMAAIFCIVGPLTIPIGPVPISLFTLVIMVALYAVGSVQTNIAIIIYLLIGMVGVPVFSGLEGGLQKLVGPTGGFLIGYILLGIIGAIFIRISNKWYIRTLGFVIGTVVLYVFGLIWFIFQSKMSLPSAMMVCVAPFIPGDVVKIAVAVKFGPLFHKHIYSRIRN